MKTASASPSMRTRGCRRGVSMIIVLMLMTVTLLGVLALARLTEATVLISGNVASKEGSVQAAEIGWNVAYAAVKTLADENTDQGGWYYARMQPSDSLTGLPRTVDFDATPRVAGSVGRYVVTYAVERMCVTAPVSAAARQCLVKLTDVLEDRAADAPGFQPKNVRQFRITVRVTDARGTQTWTQSLVTKGG